MKKTWSRLKMGPQKDPEPRDLSNWIGEHDPTGEAQENAAEERRQTETFVDSRPIEPQGRKVTRPRILKWVIFLVFIVYILISYYRAPILTGLGKYLVVQHTLKKADLIVCMMGMPVERGIAAAELYRMGLGPRIFVGREELPDGYGVLDAKKIHYPESRDFLIAILQGLGVPESNCLASDSFADSTFDEARIVREMALTQGYRTLIIVTSPTHARRTWLTFKKVFGKDEVKIMMKPSQYSEFRSDNWWKKTKYIREVIIEYQKLIYFALRYSI